MSEANVGPRRVGMRRTVLTAVFIVGAATLPRPAGAQDSGNAPSPQAAGTTVPVIPGPQYAAGSLHRRLFGDGWRSVWSTAVDAPVFGFDSYAGGVDWDERGGGSQSITLHLDARDDWREYIFRSVNKFPVAALPSELHNTTAGGIVSDMVSALFPAAPLLVPPFMDAVGLLHVEPVLRVMPDDPRLGMHRDTFAGMLGTVELRPNEAEDDQPGFAGSPAVKGTEEFFNDLEESKAHRLDERAFLTARLLDFLINDTDRARDNMRWARFGSEGDYLWQPISVDRDWAFINVQGWAAPFFRGVYPKLAAFEPRLPSLTALTYSAHLLDRRLLQRLTRDDFDEVAREVQAAITDEVVDAAIARMPARWRQETDAAARIREAMAGRRGELRAMSLAFYDLLAKDVDIHGTDEIESVSVERHADGRVRVFVTWPEGHARAGDAFYDRTFLPSETEEVRVYLRGGDDRARVIGTPSSTIAVRLIGGEGDDVLVDSAGGGNTHFYAATGVDTILAAAEGTRVSRREWEPPYQSEGLDLSGERFRDWGSDFGWSPHVDYGDVSGVVVGLGPRWTSHGFRRLPRHRRVGARVLYATEDNSFGAAIEADYQLEAAPFSLTLSAGGIQFDGFRFYGFGNETANAGDAALVPQDRVFVEPTLRWHLGWREREGGDPLKEEEADSAMGMRPLVGSLDLGPIFVWTDARPATGSPLDAAGPDAPHSLARGGVRAALALDGTDVDGVPRRGWRLDVSAAGYPFAAAPAGRFTEAAVRARAYIPILGGTPNLALRVGGSGAWGDVPIQHSASVGGRRSLRGYRSERYRGDEAAFGSAELRVPLTRVNLLARWNLGVFGLVDVGRVWFEGASPGGWHRGAGGGVWLEALGLSASAAYARGEEDRFYLNFGPPF